MLDIAPLEAACGPVSTLDGTSTPALSKLRALPCGSGEPHDKLKCVLQVHRRYQNNFSNCQTAADKIQKIGACGKRGFDLPNRVVIHIAQRGSRAVTTL